MHAFPFLSFRHAMLILRVATAIFFMAHALVRIVHDTIPRFGGFLESKGFPAGVTLVWIISIYEICAGLLLIANRHVRLACSGLMVIVLGGIVLIHARLGWFVGEHGTGGVEYSLSLLVGLLVLAAYARDQAALENV
jgi:putative oxidoreductase